ncbi:MAG: hypothetical protein WEB03_03855 [Nitriliruptor sp.]
MGTSLLDSFEGRDAMIASGMEVGIREGYERLDEVLAGERTRMMTAARPMSHEAVDVAPEHQA